MATATRTSERPRFPFALALLAAFAAAAGFGAATPAGRAIVARIQASGSTALTPAAPPPPATAALPPDAVLVSGGFVDVEGGDRKLAPGIAGIVAEVVAPEGSQVAEGAPLLRLRSRLAEEDLELARAALAQADKKLAIARKGTPLRDSRVIEQEQAVAGAESALQNAEDNYRRIAGLEVDSQIESRREGLRRLVDGKRAELEVQRQRMTQLQLDDPADSVALAASDVVKARAAVAKAEEYLALHVLLAPEAGRVLRVFVGKGAAVAPGPQPALVFLPARPPLVRCEIDQEYSRRLAVGQPVEVRPNALDGPAWKGRIARVADWIGPRRYVLDEPLERNDVRTMEVIVAFDEPPAGLRHGERVRVTVTSGK
jgi:multidrug resistance efflux pump